jgi:hypothetical protein
MKKIILLLTTLSIISCKKDTKAYQIIITPEKEYYTTFYVVDHNTNCIEFVSYEGDDSSIVKVCDTWDVKPNPDYEK